MLSAAEDKQKSSIDQRKVVDPSFLDLVRFGIEKPKDPDVVSTLPVIAGYGETRTAFRPQHVLSPITKGQGRQHLVLAPFVCPG